MSSRELSKIEIIGKLLEHAITQQEAANALELGVRQIRRLLQQYRQGGAKALISKKRGQPSNHRVPTTVTELAIALIEKHYHDFGPTLAHEKLTEVHGMKISVSVVRLLMIKQGLWKDKKIKRKRVYQLRPRRSKEGELQQMDGSPHAWFEDRGPSCTLIYCIDDATNQVSIALFVPSETMWAYFRLMRKYIEKHGRPCALYLDKHGVFRVNHKEALSGMGVTQFGRAMQELGIKVIYANSPQAKGRIERCNGTFQDRLVKELRLRGISTMEEGNAFLPEFLEDFCRRFAVVPNSPEKAYMPLLPEHDLDRIFTIQNTRILSKNLTFQYSNLIYQIHSDRQSYTLRKARVLILEKEDESIQVLYKGKPMKFSVYAEQKKQGEAVDAKNLNELLDKFLQKKSHKPSKHHPWRSR